ncbi:MAG: HEPN domain-containing protein [Caldimicrobium sp.]
MQRLKLVKDYLFRAEKRIKALEFLKEEKDYADVVREAQEVVELLLKALIMAFGLEVPKVHDVSKFIEANKEVFPQVIRDNLFRIKEISRKLRKERELAFYGLEDWIPSEEYTLKEAEQAIDWAKEIQSIVKKALDMG